MKSFHLKGALYFPCVVPEGRTRINERSFKEEDFTIRNGGLTPAHNEMPRATFVES